MRRQESNMEVEALASGLNPSLVTDDCLGARYGGRKDCLGSR